VKRPRAEEAPILEASTPASAYVFVADLQLGLRLLCLGGCVGGMWVCVWVGGCSSPGKDTEPSRAKTAKEWLERATEACT
jgi:hypothetical protein